MTTATPEITQADQQKFCEHLNNMTASISATRGAIKKLSTQLDLDTKDGISLLSLKHHVMISYLQSLALLSVHRILGHTLSDRTSSENSLSFSAPDRDPRGTQPGDLVDSLVEKRIVLEKVKALESKMRYQIEKLVRLAEESPEGTDKNVVNDPLAFRPNPQNFMDQDAEGSASEAGSEHDDKGKSSVYRPPKLAPMPYTESSTNASTKNRRKPIPTALAQLSYLDPHIQTTSGLGGTPALQSARAKELARMTEFEEENFTRLVMKKKDAKRRRRDEEDIALGGTGALAEAGARGRGRRGIGLEDEFADVLKSVDRRKGSAVGDGYEELRQRGRKKDALARAKMKSREEVEGDIDGDLPPRKKGRFERDKAALKKSSKKKMKR